MNYDYDFTQEEGLDKDAMRMLDYNAQYWEDKKTAKRLVKEMRERDAKAGKKSFRTGDKHNTIYFR